MLTPSYLIPISKHKCNEFAIKYPISVLEYNRFEVGAVKHRKCPLEIKEPIYLYMQANGKL